MVGDDLAQVGHLLEQLGKQLQGVWVVDLQLQLQGVKHRLLELLDGFHVQQAGTVWTGTTERDMCEEKRLEIDAKIEVLQTT